MTLSLSTRLPAAATLLVLFAGACAASDSKSDSNADNADIASGDKNRRAYRAVLDATDLSGKQIGPAPAGKRATLFVVFASWCGPCRSELATLAKIRKAEPRVRIIGLNAYEEWGNRSDNARLRSFLADNAPWLRAVHADGELLAAFGGVTKIPTVFVYDQAGTLVREFRRSRRAPATRPELEAAIRDAIASRRAG